MVDYAMSSDDIKKYGLCVETNDILNEPFRLINELKKKGAFVLHYPIQSEDSGHWTLLLYHNKTSKHPAFCEFFDPYGKKPDDIMASGLHYDPSIAPTKIYEACQMANIPLVYNNFAFQKNKKGVNTCGRWCILRWLFRDVGLNEFERMFSNPMPGCKNRDESVVKAIPIL
jgi:hypothetical protein